MSGDEIGAIFSLHAKKEGIEGVTKPIFAGIFAIQQFLEPRRRFHAVDETPVGHVEIRFVDETLGGIYVGGSFISYRRAGLRR